MDYSTGGVEKAHAAGVHEHRTSLAHSAYTNIETSQVELVGRVAFRELKDVAKSKPVKLDWRRVARTNEQRRRIDQMPYSSCLGGRPVNRSTRHPATIGQSAYQLGAITPSLKVFRPIELERGVKVRHASQPVVPNGN